MNEILKEKEETIEVIHTRYFDYNQGEYGNELKDKANPEVRTEYEQLKKEFDKLKYACNSGARFVYRKSKEEHVEFWRPELMKREYEEDVFMHGASFIVATNNPRFFKKLSELQKFGIEGSYIEIPPKYRGNGGFGHQGVNYYPYFSITFYDIDTMKKYNTVMKILKTNEYFGVFK